ncbi:MAG: hypothetical protein J5534_04530 [Fibrobacter sp.]|nr:hypothetical protein [Fibrobacter sp.]
MKKKLLLFALLLTGLLTGCIFDSDDEEKWDAAKVCPETGTNAYGMPNRGTFTDERDGEVYRYTTIGNQVWMAENLRYALPSPYSMCYGMRTCFRGPNYEEYKGDTLCRKDTVNLAEIAKRMNSSCTDNDCIAEEYCKKFGRYYALKEKIPNSNYSMLNRDVVDSVCPKGWHLPTEAEWQVLLIQIGEDLSRYLSDESQYFREPKIYLNECSFSVLYGGFYSETKISELFYRAQFWSSTTGTYFASTAYFRGVNTDLGIAIDEGLHQIRCLKN